MDDADRAPRTEMPAARTFQPNQPNKGGSGDEVRAARMKGWLRRSGQTSPSVRPEGPNWFRERFQIQHGLPGLVSRRCDEAAETPQTPKRGTDWLQLVTMELKAPQNTEIRDAGKGCSEETKPGPSQVHPRSSSFTRLLESNPPRRVADPANPIDLGVECGLGPPNRRREKWVHTQPQSMVRSE